MCYEGWDAAGKAEILSALRLRLIQGAYEVHLSLHPNRQSLQGTICGVSGHVLKRMVTLLSLTAHGMAE